MALLESEPRSYTRARAATMLAFAPGDPGQTVQALRAAVAEDEDAKVRIAASAASANVGVL